VWVPCCEPRLPLTPTASPPAFPHKFFFILLLTPHRNLPQGFFPSLYLFFLSNTSLSYPSEFSPPSGVGSTNPSTRQTFPFPTFVFFYSRGSSPHYHSFFPACTRLCQLHQSIVYLCPPNPSVIQDRVPSLLFYLFKVPPPRFPTRWSSRVFVLRFPFFPVPKTSFSFKKTCFFPPATAFVYPVFFLHVQIPWPLPCDFFSHSFEDFPPFLCPKAPYM